MLAKKDRIHGQRRFKEIYRNGSCFFTRLFNLRYLSNNKGFPRLAVVISAKTSKMATERNKEKRQLSSLFREIKPNLDKKNDYILVVKKPFVGLTWLEKRGELIKAFKNAKLWKT